MKKYIGKSIGLLLIVLVASIWQTFGQRVKVSSEVYSQTLRETMTISSVGPQRTRYEWQWLRDGIVTKSRYDLFENARDGKMREYSWESEAGVVSFTEKIFISDDQCFSRKNDGVWKRSCEWGHISRGGLRYFPNQFVDYSIESIFLDGKSMSVLESYTVFDNSPITFSKKRTWITSDGKIYRDEITTGIVNPLEESERFVKVYEYDPKDLKIEAPMK